MDSFEWDEYKNQENQSKHGVSFEEAQHAFVDPDRLILADESHSTAEERWFCVGRITTGIITVRFTYRDGKIRIFGAGYWRKMRRLYFEQKGVP
ncbi:MAG: BrnT family toxin [Caldilineaceae bacterium]